MPDGIVMQSPKQWSCHPEKPGLSVDAPLNWHHLSRQFGIWRPLAAAPVENGLQKAVTLLSVRPLVRCGGEVRLELVEESRCS